jgi:phosphoglycolate phosphatase
MNLIAPISPHPLSVKGILFDFDGTIADTLSLVLTIFNHVSPEYGLSPLKAEDVQQLRSMTSEEILRRSQIPFWQVLTLLLRTKKELHQRIHEVCPIPGIQTMLVQLHSNGYQLGILTSNSRENVTRFLEIHGMESLFTDLLTGASINGKPRFLRRYLKQKQWSPQDILYVGDETRDIDAARKAQVPVIAVSWGFNTRYILARQNPDYLIEDPQDLLSICQGHAPRADSPHRQFHEAE